MSKSARLPAFLSLSGMVVRYWGLLTATSRVEFQRRYAGSTLGLFWTALNPLLFLGVYLFLFLVVFQVRLPQYAGLGYAVMIFSGLVPYMCFTETMNAGTVALKQNMHLIKNVVMPIDLIPLRVVMVALITQLFGLVAVLILAAIQGELALKALWMLPLAMGLQLVFLAGLALFFSALGVLIPDLAHIIGTLLLLLMFVSPVAFNAGMIPPGLEVVTLANPVAYMIEVFRSALMASNEIRPHMVLAFAGIAFVTFWGGAAFFRRFKTAIVDYE
jgi:lipopolysaccharide transport system permease protein